VPHFETFDMRSFQFCSFVVALHYLRRLVRAVAGRAFMVAIDLWNKVCSCKPIKSILINTLLDRRRALGDSRGCQLCGSCNSPPIPT